MSTKQDLSDLSNQDWSKFDFTRWNLEGLTLPAQTAALASVIRDASVSAQPGQALGTATSTIKSTVLNDLQGQAKQIQDALSKTDAELALRTTTTQSQITAVTEQLRTAGLPPAPAPDAASFQVVVKTVEQASGVGLPGLQVRVFDVKDPNTTLASGITDQNGNAIFKLTREQTDALNKNNGQVALEVLTQNQKSVFKGGQPVTPALNQTGTLLASIPSSADLTPHLNAGNAAVARQQQLLAALTAKRDGLTAHSKQVKDDIQQQRTQVQDMIASLQTP
jgi:hypothetical protein